MSAAKSGMLGPGGRCGLARNSRRAYVCDSRLLATTRMIRTACLIATALATCSWAHGFQPPAMRCSAGQASCPPATRPHVDLPVRRRSAGRHDRGPRQSAHQDAESRSRSRKAGIVFRNAYCLGGNSPAVCTPSRNMLLSGRTYLPLAGTAGAGPTTPNFPDGDESRRLRDLSPRQAGQHGACDSGPVRPQQVRRGSGTIAPAANRATRSSMTRSSF